jgi:hypothetical protein
MDSIGAFTPEQARLLWQDYLQRMRSTPWMQRIIQEFRPRNVQVILREDLYAAVDSRNDPSYAQAAVLENQNGRLVVSGRVITIVNRFENISVDAGTYAKVEWISGEWQPYAADCGSESVALSLIGASAASIDPPDPGSGPDPETEPP